MTNKDELLKEAIEQVISAGIEPGKISPYLGINTRAKSRFGQCKKIHGVYDYKIEISSELLEATKDKLMNTLVHEVLHTCRGCMNHGPIWANYASIMNYKFGYDISRTSSYEKIGIERPKSKYTIECQRCGNKFHRQQRSKLITHTSEYKCKCGGTLKLN